MSTDAILSSGGLIVQELSVKDQDDLNALLNQCFPVPVGRNFVDDFPIWNLSQEKRGVHLGIFTEGKLIGSAGVRIADYQIESSRNFSVAMIGAVATNPEFRGQGIAKKLIDTAVDWARDNGAAAVVLWGSEHDFYRKLGFELCGIQGMTPLKALELPEVKPGFVKKGWDLRVGERIKKRGKGVRVGVRELDLLPKHREVKWYFTENESGVDSYAALGRGIDLAHLVHEWGGDSESLRQILAAVRADDPDAMIMGPPSLLNQREFLIEGSTLCEYLCLCKILNPQEIVDRMLGEGEYQFVKDAQSWVVKFKNQETKIGFDQIAGLLFGPVLQGLPETLEYDFPIELWFWGLDAV